LPMAEILYQRFVRGSEEATTCPCELLSFPNLVPLACPPSSHVKMPLEHHQWNAGCPAATKIWQFWIKIMSNRLCMPLTIF
jgi:hypothetical protein